MTRHHTDTAAPVSSGRVRPTVIVDRERVAALSVEQSTRADTHHSTRSAAATWAHLRRRYLYAPKGKRSTREADLRAWTVAKLRAEVRAR